MNIYVYIYIFIYVYKDMYIYIHIYIYMYIYIYTCDAYLYICSYIILCLYTCIYTNMHTSLYIYICMCFVSKRRTKYLCCTSEHIIWIFTFWRWQNRYRLTSKMSCSTSDTNCDTLHVPVHELVGKCQQKKQKESKKCTPENCSPALAGSLYVFFSALFSEMDSRQQAPPTTSPTVVFDSGLW